MRTEGSLATRARNTLDEALINEKGWTRIRAAEALIALGQQERVRALFESELPASENTPERVGVWRILATTVPTSKRADWIARMERTFLEPSSPDRLQAIESLCKLNYVLRGRTLEEARKMERTLPRAEALFALWALCLAGEKGSLARLADSLDSPEVQVRRRTGLVLRWIAPPDQRIRQKLARAIEAEPLDTAASPFLLSAGLWLKLDPARAGIWRSRLEDALALGPANVRFEACQTLMRIYTVNDLPRIAMYLRDPDGETRIGAAWTVLFVGAGKTGD
ncbi:MAG: hypothetical protein HY735_36515 [Verrucomicrobia bacterium]|nr:hypothetical protein [Verrucomicrobiota bacterium]